ncbi:TATA box-binding protein-associated factor RNA polymerase I subunit C-like isoform X1 [Haliotis rubra]|uniref:TATA box-binding protein-associated factor RNA polymerase I subunit C-like isoform X1 n=1 Tax=Haliotis rubra TaxID=36100 RepID=UPI001EE5EEC4|nr:TATA box-binding protein-associated factor RNA polymerase I subunit C-like isoform X1 [Haliotis rubra]
MDVPFTFYPSVYQHHSSQHTHRDYFLDYGSHMNIDIEGHQLLTKGRLETICQKCHQGQEENLHLSAIFPTLPLAPHPADVTFPFPDGISDPVRDCQEKTHFFIAKVRHNQGRLRLNSMSQFHQNIIQVGHSVSTLDPSDCRPVDKICSSVPRLAVMWRDYKHLIKYNKYLRVNSAYTGGSLCLMSLSDNTYLLHPTGEHFNRINVTEVLDAGHQGFKLGNTVLYEEQTASKVLEMRTSYVNNIGLCCTRGDTDYTVYRVAEAGTIVEPVLLENRHLFGETPTSVCLSPYICGEMLVSTDTGCLYLSVPGCSLQTLVSKQPLRFQSTDQWRQCHWGAHPRQVILADHTSVQLFDSRTQYSEGLDLLAQPTRLLHQQERIMVTQPHPHCPYYHFIATDFSLLMMDQRLPNYPVMVWPHSLPSAPQYVAVANTTSSDSLVLAATQSPPETHCFHVKYGEAKPVRSQYQPWRLSTISAVMTTECKRSLMGQVIQRRLDASLAGVAATHTGSSAHMYQLTIHGEVFYQVYSEKGHSSDKTCSYAHRRPEVSAVVKEVTGKWLAGFYRLSWIESTTPEDQLLYFRCLPFSY